MALSYNFMQSMLNKNFEYAYNLLDQNLKEKINKEQLKEFLPDLRFFKFIEKNKCFAVCKTQEFIIDFSITENKISDLTTN